MHLSSLETMNRFICNYLTDEKNIKSVLDFGSKNINGSYKSFFHLRNGNTQEWIKNPEKMLI